MARQFQLRGDTLAHWNEADPVLADREFVLIATNPYEPTNYDQYKVGNGIDPFSQLPFKGLPAVQQRGYSLTDIMSQYAVTKELEQIEKAQGQLTGILDDLKKHFEHFGNGEGNWHKQNTDTGTDSNYFQIHRIRLENCHNGLELRNETDTDYEDMTLRNLCVKGKLQVDKGITETEVEHMKTHENMIILNEGETGEGISQGIAGIEMDRGTSDHFYIIFDETDKNLKAGTLATLSTVVLIGGVLKNGAGLIWDKQQNTFIPTSYIRHEQIKILNELPGEEEDGEDGDIIIIPTEEELGSLDDFVEEFLRTVVKPFIHISVSTQRKHGQPGWVDGTITLIATSPVTVADDIIILYQHGEEWLELTIPKGQEKAEITLPPEMAGKTIPLKLKNIVGDDLYIYTLDKNLTIVT